MTKAQNRLRWSVLTGLLAAMSGCVPAALAQATDPTATGTTSTTPGSMGMTGGMEDYHILNNPVYDYMDLRTAQAIGYSNSQIATIAKIARLTYLPFRQIRPRVCAGQTFAALATQYGLPLSDVMDSSDEQARIEEYLRLYDSLNSLGTVHTTALSTAQTIPGPTLADLEAQFNQMNAQFPALPPTNIETTPIGSAAATDTTTTVQAPPPPVAPPPPAPTPEVSPTPPAPTPVIYRAPARRTWVHKARHRKVVRRHRRTLPAYKRRMGS